MDINFAKTTSRLELRRLPHKVKMEQLKHIANRIADYVERQASVGITSVFLESQYPGQLENVGQIYNSDMNIADDEVTYALMSRLPDCDISWVSEWVDVPARKGSAPTRVLKSGLKIDWS